MILPILLTLATMVVATTKAEQHRILWFVPSGGGPLPPWTAAVGDTVMFYWDYEHNVYVHPSGTCDRDGAVLVGSSSRTEYEFTVADAGKNVVFACDVGSHCALGQRLTVAVAPLLPRCEDHDRVRTVFVPRSMLLSSDDPAVVVDEAWTAALCCVNTHVRVVDSTSTRGRLSINGTNTFARADSFEELATGFLNIICATESGAEDCRVGSDCIAAAQSSLSSMSPSVAGGSDAPTAAPLPELPKCASERPDQGHRTLYVPKTMVSEDDSATNVAWTQALCCLYTHVRVIDSDITRGRLVDYDKTSSRIQADSFATLADAFTDQICATELGAEDCALQAECVDAALVSIV